MTAIPDTGTWYNGPLNTEPQQYDVLVAARGSVSSNTTQKLDLIVTPYKTPDFFELDNGKLVVAEPKPMGIVSPPKGHGVWVKVVIRTINGKGIDELTEMEKHVCLGVRIRGEEEYFDVISANQLESAYIGITGTDVVELVPLLSKSVSKYSEIEPGREYPPADSDYTPPERFNFGSVFRISATMNSSSWVKTQSCQWTGTYSLQGTIYNKAHLGVGPIIDETGQVHNNQLVGVTECGQFFRSPNGMHWYADVAGKIDNFNHWEFGPVYGNGVWCVFGSDRTAIDFRSDDNGSSWVNAEVPNHPQMTEFGNGIFMTVAPASARIVSTSAHARNWTKIYINTTLPGTEATIFIYGCGRWVFGRKSGALKLSDDDGTSWPLYNSSLTDILNNGAWYGGCYVHSYFYVINSETGLIVRSKDGIDWKKVATIPITGKQCYNITYYKNMLYILREDGYYSAGIFNPDGSIDLEFDDEGNPI